MMSSKIIGFYRCKDSNGNDLYCYVTKSPSGRLNYNFTSDFDEASKIAAKFCNSNNYTKDDFKNIINEHPDSFNLNCKDTSEVLEKIKRANPDEIIDEEDFKGTKDDFDDEKRGFFTRVKEKISNSKFGTTVKNLRFNKKVRKRVAIGALGLAVAIGAGASIKWALNRNSSPTATGTKIASGVDDDKDNLDEDKVKDNANELVDEEKEKAEEKTVETDSQTTANTTSYTDESRSSSSNYSSGGSNGSSQWSTSSNVTSQPSSVNEEMNAFQDPTASIDSSNNQSGGESEKTEDPYQNVGEEEVPVTDNNGDSNTSSDEDYSQEIDVSTGDNDELTEDDITFDEGYENDGAVDDDYTYDINYDTDNSSDYETTYEELPNPDITAADGNYVSSEEEMNNQENITEETPAVTDTNTVNETDVVPVYQEETTYTQDTVPVTDTTEVSGISTTNTAESSGTDLETAVDQAIDAMATGQDASIVYNTTTGQYSTETTNTDTNVEANGLTK